jgi:hypothetical protein
MCISGYSDPIAYKDLYILEGVSIRKVHMSQAEKIYLEENA